MNMDHWVVVRSKIGAFLCTSSKQVSRVIALYNLQDPIIEKYSFDEHSKYILKVK